MPTAAMKVPLYEGEGVQRILITGVDRLERIDAGIYTFVGTINGTVAGAPERRVVIYLDATPTAIVEGLIQVFTNAADLVRIALKRRICAFGVAPTTVTDRPRKALH